MTEKRIEEPNPSAAMVRLAEDVETAKGLIREAARPGAQWICSHCGAEMPGPQPDQWLDARELRAQARRGSDLDGAVMGIALTGLVRDEELELNNLLEVRLARSGARRPGAYTMKA